MNIIEAREAAMAGKTVISTSGLELVADDFDDMKTISHDMVFGEWEIKIEPVVFETTVYRSAHVADEGTLSCTSIQKFAGKRVKVTVEVLP